MPVKIFTYNVLHWWHDRKYVAIFSRYLTSIHSQSHSFWQAEQTHIVAILFSYKQGENVWYIDYIIQYYSIYEDIVA